MASDRSYLEWHGNQWRVRVKVPTAARQALGKSKLTFPLHTDSLTEANRLKPLHVLHLRAKINSTLKPDSRYNDPLTIEALAFRERVLGEREGPPTFILDDPRVPAGFIAEDMADAAVDRAYEIEAKEGIEAAQRFHNIASGQALPFEEHVELRLVQSTLTGGAKDDLRTAIRYLKQWCARERIEPTVEALTRKRVARFIAEFLSKDRTAKTANKYISALSSYWKWLVKRGDAETNPWSLQSLPKPKAHLSSGGCEKRPFTDDELGKLLAGPASQPLADVIRFAALSGMRIEEICSLRVRNCADGLFAITRAKTRAGVRHVPIHPDLQPIVARRCEGRGPEEFVFSELPPVPPSRKEDERRSDPVSKAFGYYRRKLGVHEQATGVRQSNIDFHSLRRWFLFKVHKAMQEGAAGFTAWTAADVVGHDTKMMPLGMTFGLYPGPSDLAARRACVEAVKLPRDIQPAAPGLDVQKRAAFKRPSAGAVSARLSKSRSPTAIDDA